MTFGEDGARCSACKVRRTANLFVVVLLLALCAAPGVLSAQDDPSIRIRLTPSQEPVEVNAGETFSVEFNILVSGPDGDPAALAEALELPVTLASVSDEENELVLLESVETFYLPRGFEGGVRSLCSAVVGATPVEAVRLEAALKTSGREGVEIEAPETVAVAVRSSPSSGEEGFFFCAPWEVRGEHDLDGRFHPDLTGPCLSFGDLELFPEFRRGLVYCRVPVLKEPAGNVRARMRVEVIEFLPGRGHEEAVSTDISVRVLGEPVPVDEDHDGWAEGARMLLVLEAPRGVPVDASRRKPNREFALRVYHETRPTETLVAEATFLVVPREGGKSWGEADLADPGRVEADFFRRASPALEVKAVLKRNGTALNAAAQACAVVEGHWNNLESWRPDGRFDLQWEVDVDWLELAKRVEFERGDVLGVELHFPGARISPLRVDIPVIDDDIEATTFGSWEELAEERYDNEKTEEDYVRELIERLKRAGVKNGPDGRWEAPDVFPGRNEDPNWKDIGETLDAIRDAIRQYKKAERKKKKRDVLDGLKEWIIEVEWEIDSPDGKKIKVRLKIVFNPSRDTAGNGNDEKHGSDGGKPRTLLLVIGQDGRDADGNKDAGDGADVAGKVEGEGSGIIAVGGDGGDASDPDSPREGGDGGSAKAAIERKAKDSTGISMGGDGGDTEGHKKKAGDSGDAETTSKQGAQARTAAKAGDTGDQKFPPKGAETKTGNAKVENGDSVKDRETKEKKAQSGRLLDHDTGGKAKGGIAVASPRQTPQATRPLANETDPTTGD